jgi:multidrug resistance efflux pump
MHIGAMVGLAALLTVTIAAAQQGASDQPAGTGPEGRGILVFNPIDGRIRVLSSRPDGARVEKGEVICELDPAELQDRLASQEVAVQGLQAGVQGARFAREAAVLDLNEYKDDRYAQELAGVEGEIKLAESDLKRQEDKLAWARRMFDKGFASNAQKMSEEMAFQKARFALEQAQTRKQELLNHTKNKTVRALMGAIETARERELGKQAALMRAESTLKRLREQIARCKVAAPIAGRVRYGAPIGPGAVVQDGEALFRIVPDAAPAGAAK